MASLFVHIGPLMVGHIHLVQLFRHATPNVKGEEHYCVSGSNDVMAQANEPQIDR